MDIAAAIFLIIAIILNVFAAMAYNAKGKLNSGFADLGDAVTNGINEVANGVSNELQADVPAAERAGVQKLESDFSSERTTAKINQLFAIYLYLIGPLLAFTVYSLFKGINPAIIVGGAVAALVAELIGGLMSKYGPSNVPGALGGILALVVAVPQIM